MDFNNMKLRTKLMLLIGFMTLAMAGLGAYNLSITSQVAHGGQDIFNYNLWGVQYSLAAKAAFMNIPAAVFQHIVSTSTEEMAGFEKLIGSKREELLKNLQDCSKVAVGQEEKAL